MLEGAWQPETGMHAYRSEVNVMGDDHGLYTCDGEERARVMRVEWKWNRERGYAAGHRGKWRAAEKNVVGEIHNVFCFMHFQSLR